MSLDNTLISAFKENPGSNEKSIHLGSKIKSKSLSSLLPTCLRSEVGSGVHHKIVQQSEEKG